jgi:hypothetical protein
VTLDGIAAAEPASAMGPFVGGRRHHGGRF